MSRISVPKPPLTDAQIRDLIIKAQSGDLVAREKVFFAHVPLAKSRALNYKGSGVLLDDLLQEAYYGVLVALDHYNVQSAASFATYAGHYIQKYIHDALRNQNTNLPSCYDEDFFYEIKSYIDGVENFQLEFGYRPTDKEMSDYLDISLLRIRRLNRAAQTFMMPSVDYDSIPANYCIDSSMRPLEDALSCGLDISDLKTFLTPRQKEVLERRFGFTESGMPEKWAHISAAMGLSIGTVRLAYNIGLSKLRKAMLPDSDQP